ncbi:MAG: response regulator transcription factor [Thermoleophilia bacterium]|nr:response regulator transcription factor [Thermoleophilia bacterium]
MSSRSDEQLSVLVVDDHDVVHWGFKLLLSKQPWVGSCASATGAADALAHLRRNRVDVALVDLFLGSESGAELCEEIRRISPGTGVLLISGAGSISPTAAKAAGAAGFVSKDWRAADITMAVRMVARGMTVFEPTGEAAGLALSKREREVLELIAAGATNREIAARLFLSPHTVKEYTSSLYRKLEVRNRAEAAGKAEQLGLSG